MSQVKFGIEMTVYQGFRFLRVTKLYNVTQFAGIPAEPLYRLNRNSILFVVYSVSS
jgi:hypothetical protein